MAVKIALAGIFEAQGELKVTVCGTATATPFDSTLAVTETVPKAETDVTVAFDTGSLNTGVATVTTAAPAPILHSVWASLKKNKPFVPFMEEVEGFCKMCNDESDDDFDPTEAIERTIRCAVSDRNNISQHKIEMNKIENEHDTVVANMQYDIKQLKQQVAGLQDYINDQAKRTSDLERRLALLERENKRYKAVYPELPAEDPQ